MDNATVVQIKDYFDYKKVVDFMQEWKKLNEAEKTYFKEAVGQELSK